jgi:predicted adenine nucleotide alpha hydrolase (AANH) superfamily ATPase
LKEHILIHSCCAPCTTAVLEKIKSGSDPDISVFYYNPNISPETEEEKRFIELSRYVEKRYGSGIEVIRGKYDNYEWNQMVDPVSTSGERGFRCKICYYIRLLETFRKATEINATTVTTTLSISPYKNYEWIDEIGMLLSERFDIKWFLEKWDYKRSIELSKEYGLYRQKYCGCIFSAKERELRR